MHCAQPHSLKRADYKQYAPGAQVQPHEPSARQHEAIPIGTHGLVQLHRALPPPVLPARPLVPRPAAPPLPLMPLAPLRPPTPPRPAAAEPLASGPGIVVPPNIPALEGGITGGGSGQFRHVENEA
jgi:hypothetical protein